MLFHECRSKMDRVHELEVALTALFYIVLLTFMNNQMFGLSLSLLLPEPLCLYLQLFHSITNAIIGLVHIVPTAVCIAVVLQQNFIVIGHLGLQPGKQTNLWP